MQHIVLSTAGLPERERFAYWRQAVSEIGVPGERDRPAEADFAGRLEATIDPSFSRFRFRSGKYRVRRTLREMTSRLGDDRVWLYREVGEGSRHQHDDREFVTYGGDVVIGEPALPRETESLAGYDHEIWNFPRALLDPHLAPGQRPRMLYLSNRKGLGAVVCTYLGTLSAQVDALNKIEAAMVADNFCRLVAIAAGTAAGDHREALRAGKLAEAKRHIGTHLSDPGLSPATAAAAMKMCVRQVHSLFEPTGVSFGEYVLRRRLEECRSALTAAGAHRSVTDIAFAWGFNSLPTFYRTFRQAFGAAPSEIRDGAPAARRLAGDNSCAG